ncbi:MAG: HAD family hydrolase [Anaerolineae bacterium]|nr:HAD family hydrolase [Anaerolineae bacterium]
MLRITIPGGPVLRLEHLVMDLNGTLAVDGTPLPGVAEALNALRLRLNLLLLTADTHGTAETVAHELGVTLHRLPPGDQVMQKRDLVHELGSNRVVAMGNGANDVGMLAEAALSIAVLGREGAALQTLLEADVVVTSPVDGLALLQHPRRLIATLRRS